ncbi:Heterokaryon incompatibility protein (HET) domain containing protein [Hyaloscypha variabilis]
MSIVYRPLDNSREEIRLLDLLPSLEQGSPLRCRVRHSTIKDAEYHALSYAWGGPTDREDIEVEYELLGHFSNNHTTDVFGTTVGANLASALRHLRDKDLVFTLWADAICIDQGNNDEKSVQVQLMAKIYKTASQVIVWLGPAGEGSDEAIDALAEIGREAERFHFDDTIFSKMSDPSIWEVDDPVDDRGVSIKSFLDKISGQSSESGQGIFPPVELEALTKRPWWSRVWVLQEMLLASTVTFACGHRRLPDTQFCPAIMAFFEFYHVSVQKDPVRNTNMTDYQRSVGKSHVPIQSLWMLRMQPLIKDATLLLFDLAMMLYVNFNRFAATDPRDKIYGLLGIVGDLSNRLRPNYNYTCADVYTQAMMEFLHSGKMFSLSCFLPKLHNFQLPSWVIDWTSEFGTPFDDEMNFASAGETQSSVNFDIEGGVLSKTVMSIKGCRVSTIARTGFSWPEFLINAHKYIYVESGEPPGEMFGDHLGAINWISELRQAVTATPVYESLDYDPVFNIILCGDTMDNDRAESVRRGLHLLEGTSLADLDLWVQGFRSTGDIAHLVVDLISKAENYRYFAAATGLVGYAPDEAREDDIVVIFFGAHTPSIIRALDNGRYQFIGPAYVEGIMMGEFMKGDYVEETFKLV